MAVKKLKKKVQKLKQPSILHSGIHQIRFVMLKSVRSGKRLCIPRDLTVGILREGGLNKEEAIREISDRIVGIINKTQGKTLLFLSGGSCLAIYPYLSRKFKDITGAGDKLVIFQVDERYHPKSAQDINANGIKNSGLYEICRRLNIKCYFISQKGGLEKSATEYNGIIDRQVNDKLNLMGIFGIGLDGHTAGLLPGYRNKWDKIEHVAGYENSGEFPKRITITPKAIKLIKKSFIFADISEKENIISDLNKNIKEMNINEHPALLVINNSVVYLYETD